MVMSSTCGNAIVHSSAATRNWSRNRPRRAYQRVEMDRQRNRSIHAQWPAPRHGFDKHLPLRPPGPTRQPARGREKLGAAGARMGASGVGGGARPRSTPPYHAVARAALQGCHLAEPLQQDRIVRHVTHPGRRRRRVAGALRRRARRVVVEGLGRILGACQRHDALCVTRQHGGRGGAARVRAHTRIESEGAHPVATHSREGAHAVATHVATAHMYATHAVTRAHVPPTYRATATASRRSATIFASAPNMFACRRVYASFLRLLLKTKEIRSWR